MIRVHEASGPLDDGPRGARIFRGELIVFRALGAVADLVARIDAMVRAAFAPHDPLTAHAVLEPAAYSEVAETLIAAFEKTPRFARSTAPRFRPPASIRRWSTGTACGFASSRPASAT